MDEMDNRLYKTDKARYDFFFFWLKGTCIKEIQTELEYDCIWKKLYSLRTR